MVTSARPAHAAASTATVESHPITALLPSVNPPLEGAMAHSLLEAFPPMAPAEISRRERTMAGFARRDSVAASMVIAEPPPIIVQLQMAANLPLVHARVKLVSLQLLQPYLGVRVAYS